MGRSGHLVRVADSISRYNVPIQVSTDEKVKGRVNGSVEFLKQHLEKGEVVYGKYRITYIVPTTSLMNRQVSTLDMAAAQTPVAATS